MDIFERNLSGEPISILDKDFHKIQEVINNAQKMFAELNLSYRNKNEVREIFSKLTENEVDSSFEFLPPFIRISAEI